MSATPILTAVNRVRLARATNSTAASFGALIPTVTEPDGTADGVIQVPANLSNNEAFIIPFGVGSDTDAFDIRVVGWTARKDNNEELWIPYVLLKLTCTLTTAVGISGTQPSDTDRFCDTIASPTGIAEHSILSPTDNTIGFFSLDIKGSRYIQIQFDMLGTTTSGNAVYRFF